MNQDPIIIKDIAEYKAELGESSAVVLAAALQFPPELRRLHPPRPEGKPRPFSATEIVYHLLAVERLWQGRIDRLRSGESRDFEAMNPDSDAEEGKYNEREYDAGIAELKAARQATLHRMDSLDADELQLVGIHSRYGPMPMYRIFETMISHDKQHAGQFERTFLAVRGNVDSTLHAAK